MPKRTSSGLFDLIHSLTKAEKAYFKSFSQWKSREQDPLYVKLFDAILRQKNYDEKKIISLFNIKPNVFSSLKNSLNNILLDCLRNFHTGDQVSHKVRELIYHAEILFIKKLFSACIKILEKASGIAKEYELFTYYIEISHFIQKVKQAEKNIPWLEEIQPEFQLKEKAILNKISNFHEYQKSMAASMVYGYKIDQKKIAGRELSYEDYVDMRLVKDEKHALSYAAKINHYQLKGLYYSYRNDYKKGLKSYIELKKFIDGHEKMKFANINTYGIALHNILTVGQGILPFEEVKKHFQNLKDTKPYWRNENIDFKASYYNNMLRIYVFYFIRDKAAQLTNEVEQWLGKNEHKANKLNISSIIYFLAHLYFFNSDLKRSLYWLNKLVNNYNERVENYAYSSAKILILIIYYELGNYDQLPYLAKSTRGFLLKRQRLFDFEKKILHFFSKKVLKASDQSVEVKVLFKMLRNELLEGHRKDQRNFKVLQYFDFISWLDSKIEGRPFFDIIKNKGSVFDERNKIL